MKRQLVSSACFLLASMAFEVGAQDAPETISVTSSAFDHHGMVPESNSAYGENVSIDLTWADLPEGTQQLALICDDPKDVEIGMMEQPFVHWVMYNIPASASGLPAGLPSDATLEMEGLEGAVNGLNGLRRPGYFGPRPPANGQLHAYHFRVYALDDALNLEPGLGKAELLDAMNGHVLATGMLMGHYERKE
ncbi:MAG: YbhB/YbcL family Raf kinase inhibitor-like protein [Pseudomonadota bacterium]|nr:YbhB/YbcL family Raf kinase inhibitor-like protein [Pseudomonadota bacterium]